MHKRVNGFAGGAFDINETFVSQNLEVFAGVFVGVGTSQDDHELAAGRERDGTYNTGAGGDGGIDDLLGRFVNDAVVK